MGLIGAGDTVVVVNTGKGIVKREEYFVGLLG